MQGRKKLNSKVLGAQTPEQAACFGVPAYLLNFKLLDLLHGRLLICKMGILQLAVPHRIVVRIVRLLWVKPEEEEVLCEH